MTAQQRYDELRSDRSQFLDIAVRASDLTLPYLIRGEEQNNKGPRILKTPWQSVGAKCVVTLSSKLMLGLLPPQTSFFKLQLNDSQLGEDFPPEIRSELDLSFAKIERTIMDNLASSDDRVVVHQALKHLVVGGNALVFMGPEGLKVYPLNRYVVDRDGNGNVIEIVTKESINKKLIDGYQLEPKPNHVANETNTSADECDIYTHIKRDNNRFVWHQEVYGKILPKSMGKAPLDTNPWLVLRWNTVDGEQYGRGRVEEFIGDFKSLEALSQALVEGSASAAKVVFTVSPSSTTKPETLAKAGNGSIIQGRPDDIGVVQVGKSADFRTAYEMAVGLEKRLSDAFLILQVRDSSRTTAEEVSATQLELEQSLGGLFSLLTVEFLVPYLSRKLSVAQKKGDVPRLPKDIVNPTIVAGINSLGRGQDAVALGNFLTTISQTMGPEAMLKYINPEEVVKRMAAAQGIDVLNLVKTMQEVQASTQQTMEQQKQMELTKQVGQIAQAPLMDPTKNPEAEQAFNEQNQTNAPQPGR